MPNDRNERLAADYREMLRLQDRPYLSWIVTKGEPPFAEEYLLTVRIRTYALSATADRYIVSTIDKCTIRITLWDSYPKIAPNTKMLNMPPVFHPNWYSKGTYCPSVLWQEGDSLKDYVKRMLGTLTYDPSLVETKSPANFKAAAWFNKMRNREDLFPCDPVALTENSPDEIAEKEQLGEIIDSWEIKR